jgi:hypothetical protein
MYQKLKITIPSPSQPISGKVTTAMPAGTFVMPKATDPNELVKADNTARRIYMLEQPVVSQVDYDAAVYLREAKASAFTGDERFRVADLRHPVPLNAWVSARAVEEIQVETDNADVLNTSDITTSTTAGTAVEIVTGKLQEPGAGTGQGVVRAVQDSTVTAGQKCLTISFGAL